MDLGGLGGILRRTGSWAGACLTWLRPLRGRALVGVTGLELGLFAFLLGTFWVGFGVRAGRGNTNHIFATLEFVLGRSRKWICR